LIAERFVDENPRKLLNRPAGYAPIAVLGMSEEAVAARDWLKKKGWDVRHRRMVRLVYGLRTGHRLMLDSPKSWDVAHFAKILVDQLPGEAAILDVGSLNSELPWVLHIAGFKNVTGCDLDPSVRKMPFARTIRYLVGDVMSVGCADESFQAVTAVSTIEHGMDVRCFVMDAARILKPNGLLCISTDYWPEKVDTKELRAFERPWSIFSTDEIQSLVQIAEECDLILDGWDSVIPPAVEAPVEWNGRRYTFIALVFRKQRRHA
jgi:SAM-dependent methyltransferase